jgi:hypothetical protein
MLYHKNKYLKYKFLNIKNIQADHKKRRSKFAGNSDSLDPFFSDPSVKGGNREHIDIILEKYFDKGILIREDEGDTCHVIINCAERESDSSDFYIDDDDNNIRISYISRCGEISGTEILNKIINIGREINASFISLVDASLLYPDTDCEFDLAYYMILLNGQSWYNRFGFISQFHNREIRNNDKIRSKPLENYIRMAVSKKKFLFIKKLREKILLAESSHQIISSGQELQKDIDIDKRNKIIKYHNFYLNVIENYGDIQNYLEIEKTKEFSKFEYNADELIQQIINIDNIRINMDTPIKDIMIIFDAMMKKDKNNCDNIKLLVKIIVDLSKDLLSYHPKLILELT